MLSLVSSVAFLSSSVALACYILKTPFPKSQSKVYLSLEGQGLFMLNARADRGISELYKEAIKNGLRLTSAPKEELAAAFNAGLAQGYRKQYSEKVFASKNPLVQLAYHHAIPICSSFT